MSDSIYVKVGDAVQQLDLGGSAPEYVQRIEALEVALEEGLEEVRTAAQTTATGSAFGRVKLSDSTSSTSAASSGIAATPKAVKAAYDRATTAINSAAARVATVNGLAPDSAGNVDVGGMPLGTALPYTGSDVPAGTLRADGATYTNMAASFPAFYAWVQTSGLAVPMASYALVEGSCGHYGLDESTGSVRMPTLAAGVFGAGAASQYGLAVEAGLPDITGRTRIGGESVSVSASSLNYTNGAFSLGTSDIGNVVNSISGDGRELVFNASGSNAIYGKSDTVTPSHVKYPWVIVVYNAAVPASVAEAGEFVSLLDGKAGANLENVTAEGKARAVGWGMPDYTAGVVKTVSTTNQTISAYGYLEVLMTFNAGTYYFYINDISKKMVSGNGGSETHTFFYPVAKGDTFRFSSVNSNFSAMFYPYKG